MSESASSEEIVLKGIAASPGIAHGVALIYLQNQLDVPCYEIKEEGIDFELERFDRAILATRAEITEVRNKIADSLGENEARIFDAHLLVLEDNALLDEVTSELRNTKCNIECCYERVAKRYISFFDSMEDEYLRERVADIRDVSRRLLSKLSGKEKVSLGSLAKDSIVISEDIAPSEAADMDRDKLLGFVTDSGGKTSHAVIMARSLGIPAVVGTHNATDIIRNGDEILVDGHEGVIYINPGESRLYSYGQLASKRAERDKVIREVVPEPSQSKDGTPIALMANIEGAQEMAQVKSMNADGVGLFRTEGIFLRQHRFPSESEQYEEYRKVAEAADGAPVIIRTLDIGGDKVVESSRYVEDNSFMGFRGIRFCLGNIDVFKTQLRAILRASALGNVKLMYPMISGLGELHQANAVLKEVEQELLREGEAFDQSMEVGAMVEVPSAATIIDLLAAQTDFLSIGTNDLIQYLLAVDRLNDKVAELYEPAHPAVLRTLRSVIRAARDSGTHIGVCGEMAGDPVFAALLLGMGANALSMTSSILPEVKYFIRKVDSRAAAKLVDEVLDLGDGAATIKLLEAFRRETMGVMA
ncbi:MAG: phosphoenolpyruvate--protein phosphotransferase [Opitutales bacterium]